MNKKYLKGVDVIFWLRSDVYKYHVASNLWKHLLGSLLVLKRRCAWNVGCGTRVLVGQGPFIGCNSSYNLSAELINLLHDAHIYSLSHISNLVAHNHLDVFGWISYVYLGLEGSYAMEWDVYMSMLRSSGIYLNNEKDTIRWS